ncbi:MAG: hypothetical protein ACXV5H_08620 [Halobacteriota archaeon]
MRVIQQHALPIEVQQTLHNILSAYFRTKPLEELVDIKDRSKRPVQLAYIALAGVECSSCVSESQEFGQPKPRAAVLETRERTLRQLLSVIGFLMEQCSPVHTVRGYDPKFFNECEELLCKVTCIHDAQQLILSILELAE